MCVGFIDLFFLSDMVVDNSNNKLLQAIMDKHITTR